MHRGNWNKTNWETWICSPPPFLISGALGQATPTWACFLTKILSQWLLMSSVESISIKARYPKIRLRKRTTSRERFPWNRLLGVGACVFRVGRFRRVCSSGWQQTSNNTYSSDALSEIQWPSEPGNTTCQFNHFALSTLAIYFLRVSGNSHWQWASDNTCVPRCSA